MLRYIGGRAITVLYGDLALPDCGVAGLLPSAKGLAPQCIAGL